MKTNDETRRLNMLLAIARVGKAADLAGLIDTAPAYLSQIKNRAPAGKTGRPKAMGDEVARRIEAAVNEPAGWMDADHHDEWVKKGLVEASETTLNADLGAKPSKRQDDHQNEQTELTRVNSREMRLLTYFREVTEDGREQAELVLKLAISRLKADSAASSSSDQTEKSRRRSAGRLKVAD